MKSFLAISIILLFTRCDNGVTTINNESNAFEHSPISPNSNIKAKILSLAAQYTSISRMQNEGIEFDFDNLELVKMRGAAISSLTAKQIGYDNSKKINYGIGFQIKDNDIVSAVIVKLIRISNDIKQIEYLNLSNQLIVRLKFIESSKTMNVVEIGEVHPELNNRTNGCGSKTAACIAAAYTDLGWASVALFVVSAFDPMVAVGIAAGCAAGCALS